LSSTAGGRAEGRERKMKKRNEITLTEDVAPLRIKISRSHH
jgi:hypothetical protein